MTHATDDELLEMALRAGEPDPAPHPHVPACPDCAARYLAVQSEQDLLRRVLASPALPAPRPVAVPSRRGFPRAAVAAALLLGATAGAFFARTAPPPAPGVAGAADEELRRVPARIAQLRQAAPERLAAEYPELLNRASELYADYLARQLMQAAPLSEEQHAQVREVVDALCDRMWLEHDLEKLAREYRASLQDVLNDAQYQAFREHLVREMEIDWAREVDIVTEHLATALDLRFSESRKVRQALRAEYPKTEVPLLSLAQWPPDLLAADAALVRAVRQALTPEHHEAFDGYVASLRDGRRQAERVVRAQAAGQ